MNGSKKLTLLGALVVLAACGSGGANVKGHISDGSGSQLQATTEGITSLGGEGTAGAAKTASAYTLSADGSLTLVASADVDAQGDFELSVPEGEEKLIVQAEDASGAVVASEIAVRAGASGEVEALQPMSSETSLEAQVLIQMVKQGVALEEANAVDVQARIGAELAAQVQARAAGGADVSQTVADLATAVVAAQKTELKAYAQRNVALSQSALFDAEVSASAALDAQLAGGADAAQAYDAFFQAVAEAKTSLGVDAKAQSQGQRDSGAAFNMTVEAKLGANAQPATAAIADAALRGEAALEARVSAAAIDAILAAGDASAAASDSATQAVAALRTQVSSATSVSADATAFATFAASVSGSAELDTSVLGSYLSVGASNRAAVQSAVSASADAGAQLSTALDAAFTAAGGATGALDVDALASGLASAYAAFDASIQSQAVTLAAFGAQAQPAVDLLIVAQGAFLVQ